MLEVFGKISRCPGDLHTLLPVGRRVLVGADQAAALQDKDVLANRAVDYVLAYPREDRSRQIRADAADKYGGYHAAGHHPMPRSWRVNCECRIGLSNRVALLCLRPRDPQFSTPMNYLLRDHFRRLVEVHGWPWTKVYSVCGKVLDFPLGPRGRTGVINALGGA